MLDLDHPDTPHTFAIARADDALLALAKRMTMASTEDRKVLLKQARTHLQDMRKTVFGHWNGCSSKLQAIAELQEGLTRLSAIESDDDTDINRNRVCAACKNRIVQQELAYCPSCIEEVASGRQAISEAFGLWCI